MRTTRTLTVSLIAVFALAVPAVAGRRALLIDGSTSIFPLMTQLAAAYHKATQQPTPKSARAPPTRASTTWTAGAWTSATCRATPKKATRKGSCSRRSRATACA